MHRHARRLGCAIAVAVAVVTASTVVAAAPAVAVGTGAVAGTVRSGADGLAGVVVTARTPDDRVLATTTTRADGRYTLDTVPSGSRSICFDGTTAPTATAPLGFGAGCYRYGSSAAFATPVEVQTGRTVRGIDGTLAPLAAVEGRVTDTTGAPVAGVAVQGPGLGPPTTTDGDGRYRLAFAASSPTTAQPCFDAAGIVSATAPAGLLAACAPAPVVVAPSQLVTVDQVLERAGAVVGRVTDLGGTALRGVRVVVSRPGVTAVGTATTAADGRYRVAGLPPGVDLVVGFDGRLAAGGASATGYVSQCWDAP